jgi:hypothetical protein
MKTTQSRFNRLVISAVATSVAIVALAVPPPTQNSRPFETRLYFGTSPDPLNASAPWGTSQVQGATTTSFASDGRGSLRGPVEYQQWQDIDRATMKFNVSPGGTGSYEFWVQVYPESTYGKFMVKIKGTLQEVSRDETVAPATVKYRGTAQIVGTKGSAVQGWTLTGGTVEATGDFTRDVFDTCPNWIGFPQDKEMFPNRSVKGFHILGTLVMPPVPPPAPQFAPTPVQIENVLTLMENGEVTVEEGLGLLEGAEVEDGM